MSEVPVIVGLTLNFRDAQRSAACVQSLLVEGAAHVLVWDNSDDQRESARALRTAIGADPRVSIEISPANLGFAAGVNRGMDWIAQHHAGAWVLLINNDARLVPGALPALRGALAQHPEAKLAYPDIDHGDRTSGTVYYQRWFGLLSAHPLPGSDPHASGCCLLFNTALIGPDVFDEDFFMYGEDAELGCRLSREPGAMLHVPVVWVRHDGSASSGLGTPFYEARMVTAHLILARKLSSGAIGYGSLLLGRTAMLGARALVRALRYRSLEPLRALRQGWRLAQGADPLLRQARLGMSQNRRL
ncbi:glycosyltransferase [uncultured Thiodictyon sp.]|uniref:glycosyltransferase n=1 Tax=uncultured Thiodictyon sp. TaxID=1846217 RepID=UPI0025F309CA|nr:glycosyltransferase [uncultured Thiodictyon sp.]